MEKYAVIQFSGRQFLVNDGDILEVERQPKSPKIDVLMYFDGKKHVIGEPFLENSLVKVTNIEDKKAKKIRVVRFKSKSRYRKVKGHRQPISVVKVEFGSSETISEKKVKSTSPIKKSVKSKKVVKGKKPSSASVKSRSTSGGKASESK